ncbi:MAG: LD-carboxypeptidase [Fluviicola sp.]|nr:LD-carboxypeptidase [Fluviicola sp.]
MSHSIPALQKGDLIYITAPAKSIDISFVDYAKNYFENQGYKVLISQHCTGEFNYFSGTDEERTADFQYGIDHPEVQAIVCARGGYGCVRIVDRIQWAGILREPKWIIGFSDVTVFHQRMQRFGLPSIHGTMPLNFKENSQDSFTTLEKAWANESYSISSTFTSSNKQGSSEGQLVGGNLSILYSLLGTDDQINYENSILFIEDLAEQIYHLDRMLFAFAKAGIFDKIKGLIVGGMTDMKDTAVPFGKTLQEVILEHFQFRNIPIIFDFPAGHIDDNRALVFGRNVTLTSNEEGGKVEFY